MFGIVTDVSKRFMNLSSHIGWGTNYNFAKAALTTPCSEFNATAMLCSCFPIWSLLQCQTTSTLYGNGTQVQRINPASSVLLFMLSALVFGQYLMPSPQIFAQIAQLVGKYDKVSATQTSCDFMDLLKITYFVSVAPTLLHTNLNISLCVLFSRSQCAHSLWWCRF